MMPLLRLLAEAGLPPAPGADRQTVGHVVSRSDTAGPDTVFACLRGHRADGHAYAGDAYRRGARVFLCERALSLPSDAVCIRTADARRTAAAFLFALYGHPERSFRITGITGTKGKTTTAQFLYHLLTARGCRTAVVGTLGLVCDGDTVPTENTTPDLFFLVPHMARLRADGVRDLVLELSSQALADRRVDGLPVTGAVLTSFGKDHIGENEHPNVGAYLAAKHRLFSDFSPSFTVYNADIPEARRLISLRNRCISCSLAEKADVRADVLSVGREGTLYRFSGKDYRLSLPGGCHVMNALLSATVAHMYLGVPVSELLSGLTDVAVPGRGEFFSVLGRTVLIDYAHNGMSFRAVADVCRKISRGRLVAVFGSVGGRGYDRRAELAAAAEACFDFSVITSDNPGFESPDKICLEIYNGFNDKSKADIVTDREAAIRFAFENTRPGDVLLLLGKGAETGQSVRGGKVPFSEKEILKNIKNLAENA